MNTKFHSLKHGVQLKLLSGEVEEFDYVQPMKPDERRLIESRVIREIKKG